MNQPNPRFSSNRFGGSFFQLCLRLRSWRCVRSIFDGCSSSHPVLSADVQ